MISNMELIQTKRRFGRPTILEETNGISMDLLIETYQELHSMRKTAAKLHLSTKTVCKYIQLAGKSFPEGHHAAADPLEATNNNKIARALDELGVPIPRSVRKIQDLLGNKFTSKAIHWFLLSRSEAALEVLYQTGDLLEKQHSTIRDIYGRTVQIGMFSMYELSIDRYNLVVTINATLNFGGKVTCRMAFQNFKDLLEK